MTLRQKIFLLLIAALLAAGCGSSNDSYVQTGTAITTPRAHVVGRVFLGADVPGATLRLETLDGQTLASGTTTRQGLVHFDNIDLPSDFRAFATVPGSDIEFSAQMRNFDFTNRQVHVSVLSTLASEVLMANPQLDLGQAESLVKTALDLPDGLQLGVSLGEPNPVFSSLAFFREASENGGWNAYKNSIVAQAQVNPQQTQQPQQFLMSLDQLQRPITGLEPGLQQAVEAVQAETAKRIGFVPAPNANLNMSYDPPLTTLASPTSVGGQFLFGVAQGITGNVVGDVANGVLGWAANQLGLNYGTGGQLNEIQEQLAAVEGSLTQIQSQITDSNVLAKIDSLVAQFFPIIDLPTTPGGIATGAQPSLTSSIQTTLTNISNGSQPPLNQPVQTNINALVATLTAPAFTTILDSAQQGLTGADGILLSVAGIVTNQETGIDYPQASSSSPTKAAFFPWRQNRVIDKILPVFQQFASLQTATLNIYSEQAHNYLVYEDPVDGITDITPDVKANIASQKTQRQLLPFRNSVEGITPDLENGVMWFDQFWDADTYTNANSTASTLSEQVILPDGSVTTYDDWHLPTYGEFISLQQRGSYNPSYDSSVPVNSNNSYPDTGQATAGLVGLGFYNVAAALDAAPNSNGSNGDLWMSYYELLGDSSSSTGYAITQLDNYEFRLNHANSNTSYESKSSDTNVYCVARTLGPTVTVTPFAMAGVSYPAGTAPDGIAGTNFVAGEYAQYGVPTAVVITGTAPAQPVTYPVSGGGTQTFTPPAGSVQMQAQVTYQINLGGAFTIGYGSGTTKSLSNPSSSPTGDVTTETGSGANYNAINELINWTVANSDDGPAAHMDLLNVPYASGIGILQNSGAVTVTATLMGINANPVSGTYAYTVDAPSKTLTGIQITPRNQLYGANNLQPTSGNYSFYCTAFYNDGTVESVGGTSDITWTVTPTPNDAGAVIEILGGIATLKLNQPANGGAPYQLTIGATYQNQTDSTLIEISPPAAAN